MTGRLMPQALSRMHLGMQRNSVARFLVALVLLIAATPFITELRGGKLIETGLVALVLVSAVPAIGARRRTFWLALALAAAALATRMVNLLAPGVVPASVAFGLILLFLAFVTTHLVRFILIAPRVDSEVLCAGVAGYLMLAIFWTVAYMLTATLVPNAFAYNSASPDTLTDGFTALYFSFGVLGTVGFGDIVPVARLARMLAVAEATTGLFYVTVLLARLVGIYSSAGPVGGEGRARMNETNAGPHHVA